MKTLFLLTLINLAKAEYPYVLPSEDLNQTPSRIYEVTNLGATKSQDGVGICYGFSSTVLLENFRCRNLKISCYDVNNQLSVLDVTSYYKAGKRSLTEGGFTKEVLQNVADGDRKIIKESCLNYSQILAKDIDIDPKDQIAMLTASQNQKNGWDRLALAWKSMREKNSSKKTDKDCVHCLAVDIKNNMQSLKTSVDQIENALKTAKSAEEFIYKSILPKECLNEENMHKVPPFEIKSYPPSNSKYTAKDLAAKAEQVLLNNIPMELSFCTASTKDNSPCPDGEGHSIALVGIRKNCSEKTKTCKNYVRVRNSYGWDWQKYNNQGWVELDSLMEAAFKFNTQYGNQFTWLQEPGRELEKKTLLDPLFKK